MTEIKPQTVSVPIPIKSERNSLMANGWIWPFLALFILLILLSTRKITSYDLGTHLKAGQWIFQNHAFPTKDTFTFTQNLQNYLDPNGLYQIILYSFVQLFGYSSLTILNVALIASVFLLFWGRLDRLAPPPLIAFLLFLLSILMTERRFSVRPEIFSWFFLLSTLTLLELRNKGRDYLFLLPLIQFLWVNIEGLFILGWLVMGVYMLEGRLRWKKWDPKLVRFGLLAVTADLLNPYFLKGMFFPLTLLTRLQGANLHKQTIVELLSPWRYLQVEKPQFDLNLHVWLFLGTFFLLLLLLVSTWRRRAFHELALTVAFGYLGISAVRNIPLFTLVCIPFLYTALKDVVQKWDWANHFGKKSAFGMAVLVVMIMARVSTNAFYISDRRLDRLGIGLETNCLPVKAVSYLSQNGLNGRILNDLDFGGWLDWRGPQPSFIDGRSEVVDDRFYAEYLQSFSPMGLMNLTMRYQPQLILINYNAGIQWVDQLRHFSDWRLIYLDECAAIYARRDYAPQIPALSFPDLLKSKGIPQETGSSLLDQLQGLNPSKFRSWVRGFFIPQTYDMGDSGMGLFALKVGEYQPARDLFSQSFRQTNGDYAEIFFNLGVSNLHLGDQELGRLCLEYSRRLDPENPATLQMLGSLGAL